MSRFDSLAPVVSLFVMASFVSIGLIFLINAEQQSRLTEMTKDLKTTPLREIRDTAKVLFVSTPPTSSTIDSHHQKTLLNYLEDGLGKLLSGFGFGGSESEKHVPLRESDHEKVEGNRKSRAKRSLKTQTGANGAKTLPNSFFLMDHENFPSGGVEEGGGTGGGGSHNSKTFIPGGGGGGGSSSSDFHKIRHAMKKLDSGGLEGDVVFRMILDSIPPDPGHGHQQSQPHLNSNHAPRTMQPEYYHQLPSGGSTGSRASHSGRKKVFPNSGLNMAIQEKTIQEDLNEENESEQHQRRLDGTLSSSGFLIGQNDSLQGQEETWSPKSEDRESNNHNNHLIIEKDKSPAERTQDQQDPHQVKDGPSDGIGWVIKDDESSPFNDSTITIGHHHHSYYNKSVLMENLEVCYRTDDVLIVIAITCSLNFAFVLVIWACVRWFSSSKDKDFHQLDCEDGGDSIVFPPESEDVFWSTSGSGGRSLKFRLGRGGLQTTSLYTFRPDYVPEQILKKSYSYSMEDLRYAHTT